MACRVLVWKRFECRVVDRQVEIGSCNVPHKDRFVSVFNGGDCVSRMGDSCKEFRKPGYTEGYPHPERISRRDRHSPFSRTTIPHPFPSLSFPYLYDPRINHPKEHQPRISTLKKSGQILPRTSVLTRTVPIVFELLPPWPQTHCIPRGLRPYSLGRPVHQGRPSIPSKRCVERLPDIVVH